MQKKKGSIDYTSFAENRMHRNGHSPEQTIRMALSEVEDFKKLEKLSQADDNMKIAKVVVLIQYETKNPDGSRTTDVSYYMSARPTFSDVAGLFEEAKLELYENSFDSYSVDESG
jgi:hypothetical protein